MLKNRKSIIVPIRNRKSWGHFKSDFLTNYYLNNIRYVERIRRIVKKFVSSCLYNEKKISDAKSLIRKNVIDILTIHANKND